MGRFIWKATVGVVLLLVYYAAFVKVLDDAPANLGTLTDTTDRSGREAGPEIMAFGNPPVVAPMHYANATVRPERASRPPVQSPAGLRVADWPPSPRQRASTLALPVPHDEPPSAVRPIGAAHEPRHLAVRMQLDPIFGDHMVIQRDEVTCVWGWTSQGSVVVEVSLFPSNAIHEQTPQTGPGMALVELSNATLVASARGDEHPWRVCFPPVPATRHPHHLSARIQGAPAAAQVLLRDVVFGDVFVCSGQSNMQLRLRKCRGGTAVTPSPLLRVLQLPFVHAAAPQDRTPTPADWRAVLQHSVVKEFPGLCYFFGLELQQRHVREAGYVLPIGLIAATYKATHLQTWMPPEAQRGCGHFRGNKCRSVVTDGPNQCTDRAQWVQVFPPVLRYGGGEIYNAMIHPLFPVAVAAILWYQGESNAIQADFYRCAFPDLIRHWQRRWWGSALKPFFYVQLAGWTGGMGTLPFLRHAQSGAASQVPSAAMVTAVDLGDPIGGIHPRNKHEIAMRLVAVVAHYLYRWNATWAAPKIIRSLPQEGGDGVVLHFSGAVRLKPTAFSGDKCEPGPGAPLFTFAVLSGVATSFLNASDGETRVSHALYNIPSTDWHEITNWAVLRQQVVLRFRFRSSTSPTVLVIRYLWKDYPKCALYGTDMDLPVLPSVVAVPH